MLYSRSDSALLLQTNGHYIGFIILVLSVFIVYGMLLYMLQLVVSSTSEVINVFLFCGKIISIIKQGPSFPKRTLQNLYTLISTLRTEFQQQISLFKVNDSCSRSHFHFHYLNLSLSLSFYFYVFLSRIFICLPLYILALSLPLSVRESISSFFRCFSLFPTLFFTRFLFHILTLYALFLPVLSFFPYSVSLFGIRFLLRSLFVLSLSISHCLPFACALSLSFSLLPSLCRVLRLVV